MILSPRGLRAAVSHLRRLVLGGHVADLRPMPAKVIDGGPKGSVYQYRPPEGLVPAGPPVLFVPPLAALARCYDLRRGCSLAEHVVRAGRRSYLLDPGPIRRTDRDLGLQEWVDELLPDAVRAVSKDAGGQPVQLVGWCLGGIFALLAAADPDLPIASVAMIAAPVDAGAVRFGAPPRSLAKRVRKVLGVDEYVLRPYKILTNLDNADFLAQIEAADHFMDLMIAYPARAARQIYQTLLRGNTLMAGAIEIGGRQVDLGRVGVPVLAIAGRGDPLAPPRAVRPLVQLLGGAPQVRFEVAPGGHLGVLTGRSARTTTWRHLDRWLDEGIVRHGIRRQRTTVSV